MTIIRNTFLATAGLIACGPAWNAPWAEPPIPSPQVAAMQVPPAVQDFPRTIADIGARARKLDVPDELFAVPAFEAIYEDPSPYAAAARAMMARPDVDLHRKRIVALVMQRLPRDAFLALVVATADSVEHGASDVEALEALAFAPLNLGHQWLVTAYDQPPVQAVLARLMTMRQLPAGRKARIRDEFLTGRAKADYLDCMDMLGRPVPN